MNLLSVTFFAHCTLYTHTKHRLGSCNPNKRIHLLYYDCDSKRYLMSIFERYMFALSMEITKHTFKWYQMKRWYIFLIIFIIFYKLFCTISQNNPGRHKVPLVVMRQNLHFWHMDKSISPFTYARISITIQG